MFVQKLSKSIGLRTYWHECLVMSAFIKKITDQIIPYRDMRVMCEVSVFRVVSAALVTNDKVDTFKRVAQVVQTQKWSDS